MIQKFTGEGAHLLILLIVLIVVSIVYWTHPDSKDVYLMTIGGVLGALSPRPSRPAPSTIRTDNVEQVDIEKVP